MGISPAKVTSTTKLTSPNVREIQKTRKSLRFSTQPATIVVTPATSLVSEKDSLDLDFTVNPTQTSNTSTPKRTPSRRRSSRRLQSAMVATERQNKKNVLEVREMMLWCL
jgi:hypothetical protein